ncbi:MAG TPA: GntR family transcriptional regulator [Terriglobales bacterium]|nr:GntR family transcriptional regulator [Terriglobales bacterium]
MSKDSDVPLREQLAEQIVVLITTGQLRAGQELPSVRALARQVKVHYNTVSEAYQDLVHREWLTRQRGSKLVVGTRAVPGLSPPSNLDDLINESIQRAKDMGYSLQQLTERVRERLLAQPPDHILVVEQEAGLREVISQEAHQTLNSPVEACSLEEFMSNPGLAVGAQVFAPSHIIEDLKQFVPRNRPCVPIVYSSADEHLDFIRRLEKPSIIAVASFSESLLKTARGVFAPAIARRHTFRALLLQERSHVDLRGMDAVFCDSIAVSMVKCRQKIHYHLIADECLHHLASVVETTVGL